MQHRNQSHASHAAGTPTGSWTADTLETIRSGLNMISSKNRHGLHADAANFVASSPPVRGSPMTGGRPPRNPGAGARGGRSGQANFFPASVPKHSGGSFMKQEAVARGSGVGWFLGHGGDESPAAHVYGASPGGMATGASPQVRGEGRPTRDRRLSRATRLDPRSHAGASLTRPPLTALGSARAPAPPRPFGRDAQRRSRRFLATSPPGRRLRNGATEAARALGAPLLTALGATRR